MAKIKVKGKRRTSHSKRKGAEGLLEAGQRKAVAAACRLCAKHHKGPWCSGVASKVQSTKKVTKKTAKAATKKASRATNVVKSAPRKARVVKGTEPLSLQDMLSVVKEAVRQMPYSGRFGSKVFIYDLWERVGNQLRMSLPQFKRWLLDMNRARHLDLARADLVGAMDPGQIARSEISDLGSTFHFVVDPDFSY